MLHVVMIVCAITQNIDFFFNELLRLCGSKPYIQLGFVKQYTLNVTHLIIVFR